MDATIKVEREIRAVRNKVVNGLNARLNHPTYGYTKTGLRRDLNVLTGLVIAHRLITQDDVPADPSFFISQYSAETLDIDLDALADLIASS